MLNKEKIDRSGFTSSHWVLRNVRLNFEGSSIFSYALYKDEQAYLDGLNPVEIKEVGSELDPEELLNPAAFNAVVNTARTLFRDSFPEQSDASDVPFNTAIKAKIAKDKAEKKAKKAKKDEEEPVEEGEPA